MQLNPYLSFDGRCEAAFKFYEKALGGKIVAKMTYGETPMKEQSPAELHGKIAHIRMSIGDTLLMGSDSPPNRYEPAKGITVMLGIDTPGRGGARIQGVVRGRHGYDGRSRRPSGLAVLGCCRTNSAYRGWSTASALTPDASCPSFLLVFVEVRPGG